MSLEVTSILWCWKALPCPPCMGGVSGPDPTRASQLEMVWQVRLPRAGGRASKP